MFEGSEPDVASYLKPSGLGNCTNTHIVTHIVAARAVSHGGWGGGLWAGVGSGVGGPVRLGSFGVCMA